MDLSIIILNYNSKDFLLPCIKGIVEYTRGISYEIIIVDNQSTDGSVPYIQKKLLPRFPAVRLIEAQKNNGYASGNNLGIKKARGEYVLIMNPDIVIWDNALCELVGYMKSHPQTGIAGPRLLSPDGSLQYFCYRFPDPLVLFYRRLPLTRFGFVQKKIKEYLMMEWDHSDTRCVDWLQGSCVIVRKEALGRVGFMDERFFLFLEDTDWCRRFWNNGYDVHYVAEVEIIHYHGRASNAGTWYKSVFNKMSWIHLISAWKYFRKWGFKNPSIRNVHG